VTGPAGRFRAPRLRPRWPRPTARLRLTVLYGTLFTLAGAGLLAFTYWLLDSAIAGRSLFPIPGPTIACLPRDLACRHQAQGFMLQHRLDVHVLLAKSGLALGVMAVLAFALGWVIAGRVLRPVRAITVAARRISATSLHERLALAGPDDEFKELAGTLNDLLARLEASFTAQRNFVASASHELRTPLTLDRTLLQVTLRNPNAAAGQWRAVGQELLESGRQQERILEGLLTLATSEAGLSRREPADLAEAAAIGLHHARARIQRCQLHVQARLGPAPMHGDPDLIERLVANLVDNAVQHNIPGGAIDVSTSLEDGRAILSVANTGPVIPPADVDRLFQPFQRAASRTGNGDGHGLGLSIVAAIAAAHGAAVTACAQPQGGLRVQVSFPAAGMDGRCFARRGAGNGLAAAGNLPEADLEAPGGAMKLEILQVPDCPNAEVLAARLAELADAWPDLTVTREIVTTDHDARRLGMTGSPTLLADGTDPFARPGQSPSISCRLYHDEQGRAVPAPSLGQLRAALCVVEVRDDQPDADG
jgi:signal transduction histidine kinase